MSNRESLICIVFHHNTLLNSTMEFRKQKGNREKKKKVGNVVVEVQQAWQ